MTISCNSPTNFIAYVPIPNIYALPNTLPYFALQETTQSQENMKNKSTQTSIILYIYIVEDVVIVSQLRPQLAVFLSHIPVKNQ